MREIVKPNGDVYAVVKVEDGQLKIQLKQYHGVWVHMDAKIIPQLRQILAEAEILNYI